MTQTLTVLFRTEYIRDVDVDGRMTAHIMLTHYGENDGDGDGDVTFPRSHFTFRTVTVAVSLT